MLMEKEGSLCLMWGSTWEAGNNLSSRHCRVGQAVNGTGGLVEEFTVSSGDKRVQALHRVAPLFLEYRI